MLRVTLDIFSGRPNPSWVIGGGLAASILREIALHRSIISDLSKHTTRLGYRRVSLELLEGEAPQGYNLPPLFSIADGRSGHEAKGVEIAQKLIDMAPIEDPSVGAVRGRADTATVADARAFFARQVASALRPPVMTRSQADKRPPETMLPTVSAYETAPFAAEFWNDPLHVSRNNSYAYAANRRTDTFPQLGRASGREAASFTFEDVVEAAHSDGLVGAAAEVDAIEAPRHLVALFVWPGRDYHWYRLHADGSWGHKPGPIPARTVDNTGTRILDPRICSRAEYSDFCGFFLIPNSAKIR